MTDVPSPVPIPAPPTAPTNGRNTNARRYCFTINNPSIDPAFDDSILRYLLFGRERAPTTGTPHLQGYLECVKDTRITRLHSIPGFESAHFLCARGTWKQNYDYCTKGGDFVEFGTHSAGKGTRTDLERCRDILREKPNSDGLRDILNEHPADLIRYHRGLEFAMNLLKPEPKPIECTLRDWQQELMDIIEEHQPHPRKIHFYVDPRGAAGKSFFARYLYSLKPNDTLILSNAKHDRLYHAYTGQARVIFDMTRSLDDEHDNLPYQVMENIKNGYRPPGMYGVPPQFFNIPHVIVFTNNTPKMNALSEDRYDIHYLSSTAAY